MMDRSTPAGQDHDFQQADAVRRGCDDGLGAGIFSLPLGVVLLLSTMSMALLNTVLWELGTPPDMLWPLVIALPLAIVAGALRMRPQERAARGEGRGDGAGRRR